MGRLRGCLWLVAGLVLAGIAAVVAYITLSTAELRLAGVEEGAPRTQVVVAVTAAEIGAQLTADDVGVKEFPRDLIPAGAVSEAEQAIGRLTLVDLNPGEIILQQRLADPNVVSEDGRRALLVEEDRVLMAYPASDLLTTMDVLRPNDHVDMLISLDFPVNRSLDTLAPGAPSSTNESSGGQAAQDEPATFIVLQNVVVVSLVGRQAPQDESATSAITGSGKGGKGTPPEAILFALDPQDALVLKFVKDTEGIHDIVLRPPGSEQPFDTEAVDIDYVIRRYQIPTEIGR